MAVQNQEQLIIAQTPEEQQQQQQQLQHSLVDPTATTTYLLLHAPYTTSTTSTALCCCFNSNNNNNNNNPMKRRSPSSSGTNTSSCAAADEHRASKKLFGEHHQEDLMTLDVNGFSAMSFVPLCHGSRTFQKPCAVVGIPATPFRSPEHASAAVRGSCFLSPLPRNLIKGGFVCDPTNAASPASEEKGLILAKEEESSNSMKLKRMKDCIRELRKQCDEVMQEGEEEEKEEEDDPEGAEGDGVLFKDDCGEDAEEAVSVEWAEKCLSICFKCPCSKGYQILLSGNNCYYKLV